jgi:hypothetical protein
MATWSLSPSKAATIKDTDIIKQILDTIRVASLSGFVRRKPWETTAQARPDMTSVTQGLPRTRQTPNMIGMWSHNSPKVIVFARRRKLYKLMLLVN